MSFLEGFGERLTSGSASFLWKHMGALDNPVGHIAAGSARLAGKSAAGLSKVAMWGGERAIGGGMKAANLADRIPAKTLNKAIMGGGIAYVLGKGIAGPAYESVVNKGLLGSPHATARLATGAAYGVIDQSLMSDARRNAMYSRNSNYNFSPGGYYSGGGYAPSGDVVFGMWNLR